MDKKQELALYLKLEMMVVWVVLEVYHNMEDIMVYGQIIIIEIYHHMEEGGEVEMEQDIQMTVLQDLMVLMDIYVFIF